MKIKKAIILAAGASKRFGKNKLEILIKGKTLPQYAVEFCIANGMNEVCITISKKDFYIKDYSTLMHPIIEQLEQYKFLIDVKYSFQNEDEYGPGAALKVWKNYIKEPFITLFGDNFYHGTLEQFQESDCIVSYKSKEEDARNLQLAAIKNNIIIEKPHPFTSGDFFCGFVIFSPVVFDNIENISKSDRNEYEITDLINSIANRQFVENKLTWADITFSGDEENVAKLMGNL